MRGLLLVLAVVQLGAAPQHRRFKQKNLPASVSAVAAVYSFCSKLQSADKAGAWSCVNGDITSPTGSASTYVGVNSPAATVGTTCAAPSYLTFANGATDSHVRTSDAIAVPTGDLTACALIDLSTTALFTGIYLGEYEAMTTYSFTQEGTTAYFRSGSDVSITLSGLTTATKTLFCIRWVASTKKGAFYINVGSGGSWTDAAANAGALDSTANILRFGAETTTRNMAGKFYGGFLTEKSVTSGALDTLFAATVTCP